MERGPVQIKMKSKHWKTESRKRKLEVDPDPVSTRSEENKKRRLSRKKQRENNPEKVKENQSKWQKSSRLIDSEKKRLKRFKERTMMNAIFTCSCCQRNLFDCNVCKLDAKLITAIETKRRGFTTEH